MTVWPFVAPFKGLDKPYPSPYSDLVCLECEVAAKGRPGDGCWCCGRPMTLGTIAKCERSGRLNGAPHRTYYQDDYERETP